MSAMCTAAGTGHRSPALEQTAVLALPEKRGPCILSRYSSYLQPPWPGRAEGRRVMPFTCTNTGRGLSQRQDSGETSWGSLTARGAGRSPHGFLRSPAPVLCDPFPTEGKLGQASLLLL